MKYNANGEYVISFLLTILVSELIVLFFLISDGTKGRNQYGDNPLKKITKKKKRKN